MRTVIRAALSVVCLVFFAASALAQTGAGPTAERNMPYGLGMPKPKDKKQKSVSQYQEAKTLLADGKYEAAVPLLQRTVADDPRNDDAWHDLGYASQRLGRNNEALGYYERALSIRPSRKDTRAQLGELHLALGNLAKAEEQLAQLKQLCPSGCPELQRLEAQVAAYKAAHPA